MADTVNYRATKIAALIPGTHLRQKPAETVSNQFLKPQLQE